MRCLAIVLFVAVATLTACPRSQPVQATGAATASSGGAAAPTVQAAPARVHRHRDAH